MILNISKIKTEALLLFCKDLITTYKDNKKQFFPNNQDLEVYMKKVSEEILEQINNVTLPYAMYINNSKNFKIKAILNAYNYLNKEISKELENGKVFNPSMLYLSMLTVWFKELKKESKSKEYIFFLLYTYTKVYDELLLNVNNDELKVLNIEMLNLSEKVILKFDKASIK